LGLLKAYADLVKRLLDLDGTDYAQVAWLLIGASAKIPSVDLPTGKADVDKVLRQHGLIV
jgi:hypothetical protein